MATISPRLLDDCLNDLEDRIDDDQERRSLENWLTFLAGRWPDEVFTPAPRRPAPPRVEWPDVHIHQAFADLDAMVLSQLAICSDMLAGRHDPSNMFYGSNRRLCVRCNYGTGILPTMLGCELFEMPAETNTLPACRPLGSTDRLRALLDAGVPDLNSGLGGQVFRCAERFLELFEKRPRLREHVALYHPDTQGPAQILEVVWGSDFFYALYDEPQLVRDVLDLIARTIEAFLRKWYALTPQAQPYSVHWSLMHKGTIMLRNDSIMNLSPDQYAEFFRPLDQRLLNAFGGGAMHFCGRGDHYIHLLGELDGLTAVQISQPECNDMETIFQHTVDKGIPLIGLPACGLAGVKRPLRGLVHTG